MGIVDEVIQVPSDVAMAMARRLGMEEGVLCGISSGAAVTAAMELGSRPGMEGKRIVCVIPSFGERYLSTALFQVCVCAGARARDVANGHNACVIRRWHVSSAR